MSLLYSSLSISDSEVITKFYKIAMIIHMYIPSPSAAVCNDSSIVSKNTVYVPDNSIS